MEIKSFNTKKEFYIHYILGFVLIVGIGAVCSFLVANTTLLYMSLIIYLLYIILGIIDFIIYKKIKKGETKMKKLFTLILSLVMILGITVTMDANASPLGKNIWNANGGTILEESAFDMSGNIGTLTTDDLTEWYTPIDPSTGYITSGMGIGIFVFYDSSFTFISREVVDSTFTTPANAAYLRFNTNNLLGIKDAIQIEVGTTATAYEAYIPSPDESPAVNLFNKDFSTVTLDYNYSSIGVLTASPGDDVADWFITLQPNTSYVISGINTYGVVLYGSSYTFNEKIYPTDNTFLTGPDTYYMKLYGVDLFEALATIQIEEGTVATSYVAYIDTIAPVLTLIGDATVYVEYNDLYSELGATFTDNVDISGTAVITGTVNTSVLGSYTISYAYTDSSGNIATPITRTVIVQDTTAPVLTLTGDANVYVEIGTTYTELGATSLDDVDGIISVVTTGTVDVNTLGTYTITYTSTDSSGNVSTITRNVIVQDTVAPVITMNGIAITLELGDAYVDQGATALDNIDGVVDVVTTGTVNVNTLGAYTITYTSTDSSGNVATLTRSVIVQDTTEPVCTLIGDATVNVEQGDIFTDEGVNCTDNDIVDSVITNIMFGGGSVDIVDTSVLGTYEIYYVAYDYVGNSSDTLADLIRTVIIIEPIPDTTPPVLTLIGDATVYVEYDGIYIDEGAIWNDDSDGTGTALINDIDGVATTVIDTSILGNYIIIYGYDDVAGNLGNQLTRTVIVQDTTPPVLTLNGDATVIIEIGGIYTDLGAEFTDEFDTLGTLAIYSVDNNINGVVDTNTLGTYIVEYRYTDTNGNIGNILSRSVIVVEDITNVPVISANDTLSFFGIEWYWYGAGAATIGLFFLGFTKKGRKVIGLK